MANRYIIPHLLEYKAIAKSDEFNDNWDECVDGLNELNALFYGPVPPSGILTDGMRWWDTNSSPAVLRVYDASSSTWKWYGVFEGVTPPSNPRKGAIFIDSSDKRLQVYNGSAWEAVDAGTLEGYSASDFLQSSEYTASDILTKLLTVDGSGSGLDADTVDGSHASAFALANHTHSQYVLTSDYDDADVLVKIKAVDGSGSGLDADLLDGKHATSFVLTTDYENADVLAKIKAVDGSGSGLDADLLDGKHLSEIGGGMKYRIFTASGTFTVPSGVTQVLVTLVGGGGGGAGGSYSDSTNGGGGGGAGGIYLRRKISVTPGQNISVTVGMGGAGGIACNVYGCQGGAGGSGGVTSFGSYLSVGGGGGGKALGVPGAAGSPANPLTTQAGGSGSGDNGGSGGTCLFGLGGRGARDNVTSTAGSLYGAGGGGGTHITEREYYNGSAGAQGFCIVEWEE